MDLEKVLMVLTEKDNWTRRKLKIEADLDGVRKRLRLAEKKRRRIAREISRLSAMDAAIVERQRAGENERTSPFNTLR